MLKAFDLTGKRALVTGGSRGIGRGLAEGLYEAGANIVIVGRSASVEQTAAEIGSAERPVYTVQADLSQPAAITPAFESAVAQLGGIDILVNSHGVLNPADSVDLDMANWNEVIQVNLNAVFALCQLAGQHMIAQGRGKIINIASVLSFSGGWRVAAYAASKGGIAQLTKALANEWAAKGVNVNAICPGYIRTDFTQRIYTDPVRNPQILARIPAERWGEPADIKGAVVFLASAASDYVHGIVLPVDGGWLGR